MAHSSYVQGVGIVAGGPYACVKEHPFIVNCLGIVRLFTINNPLLIDNANEENSLGNIDPIANVPTQRIFIYSGQQDTTITNSVVRKTKDFYNQIGDPGKVKFVERRGEHNFPTDFDADGNGNCAIPFYPFVANCGYDGAGELLKHVLGTPLNPRNDDEPTGFLVKFNQSELHPKPSSIGLGEYGFLYIPDGCIDPEIPCRLHVVFHGCQQPVTYPLHRNMHFIRNSGYIQVADTNNIIMAFPQTVSRLIRPSFPYVHPGSLLACWDMFGMYGSNYATKNGAQIAAMQTLVDKIVL